MDSAQLVGPDRYRAYLSGIGKAHGSVEDFSWEIFRDRFIEQAEQGMKKKATEFKDAGSMLYERSSLPPLPGTLLKDFCINTD